MTDETNTHSIFMGLRKSLAGSIASFVPPADVEDIVQETYVKICQIKNINEIKSPKSFLYRIVRNLALDHHKRAEIRLTEPVEDLDRLHLGGGHNSADQPFEQVAANQEFGFFCEAVRRLPTQCRRAFVLKKVYGYSQKEIAREMNVSINTVENYITFGLKKCTQYMEQYDEKFGRRRKRSSASASSRPSLKGDLNNG
ncbi:RNA polymerase sigma factor [Aestuariicella hydrocarbonica]|uniref:RNA polymerase sigma factor n=1 Tax=Pseudomaricurvus hydrocarbonicus TaxID=1470433 RepID=A0A9E5T1B8_9GAMM|nr:RNA polymerase sigma factor [Aestuariicella hydrocarbonica]NHO67185.1 RNA polymerase sigma factor [Aestuariicella hydrocarbonica]